MQKLKTAAPKTAAGGETVNERRYRYVKRSETKSFSAAMATSCFGSGTGSVARKNGENGADSPFPRSGYPENACRFHNGARPAKRSSRTASIHGRKSFTVSL